MVQRNDAVDRVLNVTAIMAVLGGVALLLTVGVSLVVGAGYTVDGVILSQE